MLYDAEKREIRIAVTGDLMLTRRLSVFKEPRFLRLRELLLDADARFSNFESVARGYREGTPGLRRGTYMTTEPELLDDVSWLGINLVACANNHAFDYGEGGLLATMRNLKKRSIPFAGVGENLAEARSPAYLDTPGGRVGLVAVTSTFDPSAQAAEQRIDMRGKPGVNPLAFTPTYSVDGRAMEELRRMSRLLGFEAYKERKRTFGFLAAAEVGVEAGPELTFLGERFVTSDGFGVTTEARKADVAENLRQLAEARRQADWVIVSIHCHEMGGETSLSATRETEVEEWATFARDFAHRCIDEGADVVAGHGPHLTLGVEVYKGKPIFHSLGNLVLQNETIRFLPDHAYSRFQLGQRATPADFLDARSPGDTKSHPSHPLYWESVCAVCDFSRERPAKVFLYPLDLGFARPRSQRGRPLVAEEEVGRRIIERMARLSLPLGGRIAYEDGCGVMELS